MTRSLSSFEMTEAKDKTNVIDYMALSFWLLTHVFLPQKNFLFCLLTTDYYIHFIHHPVAAKGAQQADPVAD